MWPYHSDLLARPVPRYTSFPTAAEFGPLDPLAMQRAIEGAQGEVSLYVHIPFCERICFYCGCNTGRAGRRQRLDSYIAALMREIALVGSLLPRAAQVRRIAFGGGSPNAISPVDFVRLIDALTFHFRLCEPEFSIELDPRSMNAEWARAIAAVGVRRASMGVQSFVPHCQQAIGREQEEALIARCVEWLRGAGVSSLNFDLMYGLPGQTIADLDDSLEKTLALGADRVALFGYAHVPHVVPRQKVIDAALLPGALERFRMAERGHAFFTAHGYEAVGFDHFARGGKQPDWLAIAAREGRLRRNFQGFTEDGSEALVGLGSSAISCFEHLLAQNEKNSGRYRMLALQSMLTTTRGIVRSSDERYRGAVIESLLCTGSARVGARLEREVRARLAPFIERGLARLDEGCLTIERPAGMAYARAIASLFDPYRGQGPARFSPAV